MWLSVRSLTVAERISIRSFDSHHGLWPWARSGFRPTGDKKGTTGSARGAPFVVPAAAMLAAGLWVRLDRLAAPSFDIDEYLHVFAAQSLNATGRPALPSGQDYGRALPYTHLAALSFRVTGAANEFTARLPSVAIDAAVFAVVFVMVRGWCGPVAGLLVVALLAFAPWWIALANNCRMYTLLNLAHLTTAWAAWQALEGRDHR